MISASGHAKIRNLNTGYLSGSATAFPASGQLRDRAWDFTIEDAEDFEARWQDADHRARCSINVDRPADDGRIVGELTTPETVAQEHYRVVTRLSVLVEATVSNFLNWARPNPFALCSHKK